MKRNGLSKPERLCSESRIDALFQGGRKGSVGPFRFCWIASSVETESGEAERQAGVSVLFSVPKKAFKRAWKRNLIKRRMRESYRLRKHELTAAARAAGLHIDIALICFPTDAKTTKGAVAVNEIPDFKTIDNVVAKILEQIAVRNRI